VKERASTTWPLLQLQQIDRHERTHTHYIGVIYGGTRVTGTPTFWTEEYTVPSGRKVDEFAVTSCQRRRSAEIKLQQNGFAAWAPPRDPAGTAHDALPDPRAGQGGDTSTPFSSPLASDPKGTSFSF